MTSDGGETVVAVVGTGSIGMRHLHILSAQPGVRMVAVPRREERRRELAAQGFEVAPGAAAAAAMGARLAIIATDTGRHVADSLAAMTAGMDLLVEKPLARDAGEGGELLRAAAAAGRSVWVGNVLRFSEALTGFRQWLPRIGRPHAVRVECASYLPAWRPGRDYGGSYSARADEGGVLRDLIHEVDYAGWLFGWPQQVWASLRNLRRLGIAAEETADLTWETETGCLVSVALDYLTRPTRRGARAAGEHGSVEWDSVEGRVTYTSVDGVVETVRVEETRDAMMQRQDLAVIAGLRGGADSRVATGAEGLRALAVCDAARRASQAMRQMPVDYPGA